jgi:DNA modification methylase
MSVLIIHGDARSIPLADESVHCCVTSPPYWRQRDYKMKAQIGFEPTPEEYCSNLVSVFREVFRVLRSDGTLWLNLGEKWASGGNGGGGSYMKDRGEAWAHAKDAKGWRNPPPGYKDKDMVGIGWMVAFALRADGWFLRQCNIWAKPNGMPESVSDRSTISHEYVFQLSKNNDYFYNADAARTPPMPSSETRLAQDVEHQEGSARANGGSKTNGTMKAVRKSDRQRGHSRRHNGFNDRWDAMSVKEQMANGANLRSVWWVSPAQVRDDHEHYAVMPETIARICILAGCPAGGTVLDPFIGSGTTALVARNLQCNAVGLELNPAYIEIAKKRLAQEVLSFGT